MIDLGNSIGPGLAGFAIGSMTTWILRKRFTRIITIWQNKNKLMRGDRMKMVFVVRNDLSLKTGKVASQCAHAAIACYQEALIHRPEELKLWDATGQPKIVLQCNSDATFYRLQDQAGKYKLISAIVQDAGHTQVAKGTKTVLGIGPGKAEDIDKVTGKLNLY